MRESYTLGRCTDSWREFILRARPCKLGAEVRIETIPLESSLLAAVKSLARTNSRTLGFLPEGAIEAYAATSNVVAAIDDQHNLLGCLIYRVANVRATVVHLCVASAHRRKGVGRTLVNHLIERTWNLRGISLKTRRDFPANDLWPRLGFSAVGEAPGRGRDGHTLTDWWLPHPQETLFSFAALTSHTRPPTDAAIDMNVFYDLHIERETSKESRALLSDWLSDEVRLCLTPEHLDEIDRLPNAVDRTNQRQWASNYERVAASMPDFQQSYRSLEAILGTATSKRKESDLRHLAHTIASGTRLFVTRDEAIQNHSERIEDELGLILLRPAALVIQLDRYRNESGYYPIKLRGTQVQIVRASSDEIADLPRLFLEHGQGELLSSFRRRFNRLLADPGSVRTWVIRTGEMPVALVVVDQRHPSILKIPFLRVRPGPLATTVARFSLTFIVETSVRNGYSISTITETTLSSIVFDALSESAFLQGHSAWTKISVPCIGSPDRVADHLTAVARDLRGDKLRLQWIPSLANTIKNETSPSEIAGCERRLWPAKIIGTELSTFVVPIRPFWAQSLFDEGLAAQTLFGAEPALALNWENVYYRSRRFSGGLQAPCRVLWYVSKDRRFNMAGHIRACSLALEVEILPAREAYRRNRRLGVYEWVNIKRISDNDPTGRVMVIRFADTELFENPIKFNEACEIIEAVDNRRPTFQSPVRVSDEAFARIYERGTGRVASYQ